MCNVFSHITFSHVLQTKIPDTDNVAKWRILSRSLSGSLRTTTEARRLAFSAAKCRLVSSDLPRVILERAAAIPLNAAPPAAYSPQRRHKQHEQQGGQLAVFQLKEHEAKSRDEHNISSPATYR